jgi:hypothetical protein
MTVPGDRISKRTIVIITLAVIAAAALTVEGTYLTLKTFVLNNPNDPLTKAGGLSPEQKAKGKWVRGTWSWTTIKARWSISSAALYVTRQCRSRKAPPTLKARALFNIVASGARELSECDYSAEVEMRRAEGEEMRSSKLQELDEMAAKLLATAGKLPPGQDHHNALRRSRDFARG